MTQEEFFKMDIAGQVSFRDGSPEAYSKLFADGNKKSLKADEFRPCDIESADDFMKLSTEQQIKFKKENPVRYSSLFASGNRS